ncbi:thioredoxin [Anaerocolumna cellulosilytica]|uniref:Thioredoxin n=2 Tax=Anaerocolumna cellulosilytica TaxID=433286 RepID=A0A6S6QW31_9FIRM|nr:thioredoxin [Anaerocolumna cellulosilytica]
MMPEVSIEHRSFALVKTVQDFNSMFGSRDKAKEEILSHWEHANENDDLHRFNISGMRKASFPFPSSMKALTACKAAYFTAGDTGYWDVFDSLQNALFVQNQDIEDEMVIFECIKKTDMDFEQWKQHYQNPQTLEAVEQDLPLAEGYGIHSVPCLIVNGKYKISGAQPLPQIIKAINNITETLETKTETPGASCRLDNGKFQCD